MSRFQSAFTEADIIPHQIHRVPHTSLQTSLWGLWFAA